MRAHRRVLQSLTLIERVERRRKDEGDIKKTSMIVKVSLQLKRIELKRKLIGKSEYCERDL